MEDPLPAAARDVVSSSSSSRLLSSSSSSRTTPEPQAQSRDSAKETGPVRGVKRRCVGGGAREHLRFLDHDPDRASMTLCVYIDSLVRLSPRVAFPSFVP